jgi:hypothetical protein
MGGGGDLNLAGTALRFEVLFRTKKIYIVTFWVPVSCDL